MHRDHPVSSLFEHTTLVGEGMPAVQEIGIYSHPGIQISIKDIHLHV